MPDFNALQRISKLAPLDEVFKKIDTLAAPVKPQNCALGDALGRVLAADISLGADFPKVAVALQDGFAVRSQEITDAGPYAPVAIKTKALEIGMPIPKDFDAVLPSDSVNESGEAIGSVGPGEGVWPMGADGTRGLKLSEAGEQLRAMDIAVLQSFGVRSVSVRTPRILIVRAKSDAKEDPALSLLTRFAEVTGAIVKTGAKSLDAALGRKDVDAIIIIGGSGTGKSDVSVTTLTKRGKVEIHGFGVQPGETAAFGSVDKRPVLIVPGRFDAALSIFSIAGLRLIAKLAGRKRYLTQVPIKLSKKLTSPVGIASFVPLGRTGKNEAAPLASGAIALSVLARTDGWALVPAESEGYPAGSQIDMRLFP